MSKTIVIVMPMGGMLGGSERALWNLVQQTKGGDLRWHLVFFEDGELVTRCRDAGCGVDILSAGRVREVHKLLSTAVQIAKIARREQASLIFGWLAIGHVYGGLAAKLAGIPAGFIQHDVPRTPDIVDKLAARLPARGIVTVCQAGHDAQKALCPNTPVSIVHPGVELERFDPTVLPPMAAARVQLDLPLDQPLIGIVGRLQYWKGMHTLIAAMPELLKSYPTAQAVIVGGQHALEADYEVRLKAQIQESNLEGSVRLVGFQRDIPLWMQAMDIVVHASRREPFGIVVIEGMALGKPMVATDEGGPTEIITPGKDGQLTPFEDASALASALTRYLDDPVQAATVGRSAQERAQTFSTAIYAQKLAAVLRDLL